MTEPDKTAPEKTPDKWHEWRPTYGAIVLFAILALVFAGFQWSANVQRDHERGRADRLEMTLKTNVAETHSLAKAIQGGLIEACETSGNPTRDVVRFILQESIQNDRTSVPKLFPQVPDYLIRQDIEAKQAQKRRVPDIDCRAQYSR